MTTAPEKVQEAYGPLPAGWRLEKLKFFADVRNSNVDKTIAEDEKPVRLCNYTDVYYNDRITSELEFMHGSATEAEIEKFQLKRGQVIITKDSEGWDDIGIPALVTEDMPEVLCGYHLAVFEPDASLDGGFLAWLCRAEPLNDQFKTTANGVTRFGLGQYPMKNAFIAIPPLETQRRIARFLDEKTARIDGLIGKKQALLDRFAEKRRALITQAVTKGLAPHVPMKPSGIAWLGDIPAHWVVAALAYRYEVQLGRMLNGERADGEYLKPYLRVYDVQWGKITVEDLPLMDFPPSAQERYRLRPGDLLVNEGGSYVGRSAIWRGELEECYYQKALHRLRPIKAASDTAEFLYYVMEMATKNDVFIAGGNQTTIDHLTAEQLRRYRFAFPPLKEQIQISNELKDVLLESERLIQNVHVSIERLGEYRAAIIANAVSGKVAEVQ
jgi:type I restriction enzyme S subunit